MKPARSQLRTFGGLRRIIATLRGPKGCPWDRVQTHRSLRPYLREETSEALHALDQGDADRLCDELGDVLLQIVLHAQIAQEAGEFRIEDVIYSVADKLVRRHPHVFGDAVALTPEAVMEQWDVLKQGERGAGSALDGVPPTLPALAYAQAVQRRAASAGFAFQSVDQVWDALDEELRELREASDKERRREEIGDVLFAVANLAQWLDADAEDSLRSTCHGFSSRFRRVEQLVEERGVDLKEALLEEKLALWDEARSA